MARLVLLAFLALSSCNLREPVDKDGRCRERVYDPRDITADARTFCGPGQRVEGLGNGYFVCRCP